ncbi:MAG: hypothetical protein BWY72_02535 [Bacteroidetes bacterium ADurb.Bin416]|nr:MAG: hypothetical protein BWY72_02535 [Bacteroidetes bacterium ADurb.Bin416]
MGAFHILFNPWPHVIGKLSPFDHNANFRVEAAHAIGRTDDIIFSNGGVEHPGRAKLLLQALGDIKHPTLILVGYVLSP